MDGLQMIRIYGSNFNLEFEGESVFLPLKTEVEALPDVVYFDMDVTGCYGSIEFKPETKLLRNGKELVTNTNYIKYSPKTMDIAYPDERVTFDNYFGKKILDKRYIWVDIGDYPIVPNGFADGKLIAVSIKELSIASDDNKGTKEISLTLQER